MFTKLIRSFYNITPQEKGAVMTIGNFDGVHLGHQALLAALVSKAKSINKPSVVLTFEPHPFEYFERAHLRIPRITRLREKFCALANCGVDAVIVMPFNQTVANMSAHAFLETLHAAIAPTHLIVGDDFHFGKNRQGNFDLLVQQGQVLGFAVASLPTVMVDGERVSSTRVRAALGEGDLDKAAKLLGHPYCMMGRVGHGDKLGRQWGFPTANIYLHRRLTPVSGIFTVWVHDIADHRLPGVANLGVRPTVDGTRTLLEVHLLDFNQELYGRYVRVEFCKKLRDEEHYPDIELLKVQIGKDVEVAKHYFSNQGVR